MIVQTDTTLSILVLGIPWLVVFQFCVVYFLSMKLGTKMMCRKTLPRGKVSKLARYFTVEITAAIEKKT